MPLLRLAYTTQFLIALIAVFFVWEEVGGPYHLDLMPWWLKLGLGTGVAYAAVRATASAVAGDSAWNRGTFRWCGAMLALALGCVLANYYCNVYGEEDDEQDGSSTSIAAAPASPGSYFAPGAVAKVAQTGPRKSEVLA